MGPPALFNFCKSIMMLLINLADLYVAQASRNREIRALANAILEYKDAMISKLVRLERCNLSAQTAADVAFVRNAIEDHASSMGDWMHELRQQILESRRPRFQYRRM